MFRFVSVAVATVIASTAIAQDFFLTVNLLPFANDRLQARNTAFPTLNHCSVPQYKCRDTNPDTTPIRCHSYRKAPKR